MLMTPALQPRRVFVQSKLGTGRVSNVTTRSEKSVADSLTVGGFPHFDALVSAPCSHDRSLVTKCNAVQLARVVLLIIGGYWCELTRFR